jgi:hypothetical protein
MKKLTLDQLEVENFAMQPSEEELSNLKGGSTAQCISAAVALAEYLGKLVAGGGSSSSTSSSSSGPYLHVTDSSAMQVIRGDTTYFHSHTYKYGF